jgi:hypothetical protein
MGVHLVRLVFGVVFADQVTGNLTDLRGTTTLKI